MNTDDLEPSNVVAINEDAAKQLEILRKEHSHQEEYRHCIGLHKRIMVDDIKRTVTCEECGRVVDAFDYLFQWAKEGSRRMTGLKSLDVQIRVKNAEVRDLERKISNLRATLKRLGGKEMDEHWEFKTAELNPQSERCQEFIKKKEEA